MPTAEVLPDGHLGFTVSGFGIGNTVRGTMVFQMLPSVYGTFRYSTLKLTQPSPQSYYDRSFDIHFQLREESNNWPAIAVGLRDIGGTGIYAGEYVVATKSFSDRLSVTGGMGWGRLASHGGFKSPLCAMADRFCTRPVFGAGISNTGGQLSFDSWFRGDAALFGGFSYKINDSFSVLFEYSSDSYQLETKNGVMTVNSPFNFGATYKLSDATTLSAYYMHGSEIGLQLSYVINPASPRNNAGTEKPPPSMVPVDRVAAASWNLPDRAPGKPGAQQVLAQRMSGEGLALEGLQVEGNTATIRIENFRYGASAQAVGRANRAMANTLPSQIDTFVVVLLRNGLPITRIETKRADLAELEQDLDGSWRSLARADISDAAGMNGGVLAESYPRFDYRLGPYATLAYFDPDNPLRGDVGVELNADLIVRPGFTFSGRLRQPIFGNLDQSNRLSDSVLPHVRSDWPLYAKASDLELTHLTAEYIWRPRRDFFARVTAGYLEPMYGGISGEVLWYPVGSKLALGAEMNWTRQRDFDMLFDFRDYNVTTGHASVYYNFDSDYNAQIDMGRYLAGDWGATFTLEREFNNGFKVGGFFTLTNVSFADFGEGSFDKGITLDIPLSWFTGKPSRRTVNQTIRPVLRDGGARLIVRNRLYEYTKQDRGTRLASQWGRYFR